MKKRLLFVFLYLIHHSIFAVDIVANPNLTGVALPGILSSQDNHGNTQSQQLLEPQVALTPIPTPVTRMFGAQLFTGAMVNSFSPGFNPNYHLTIGDQIQLRMWGAFNYDGQLTIDPKGNVFIPNVGPINLVGAKNSELNNLVTGQVKKVYQSNVNVYAALNVAQPVKVYVSGFVNRPGLYSGVASDSLVSYLDKAGGVDPERGSYINIKIRRNGVTRKVVNLYDFLLEGTLDLVQFNDGDVIVVGPRQYTFSIDGEVFNSYDFEFRKPILDVSEALRWARPKPGATNLSVIRHQGNVKLSEYHPISDAEKLILQDGDQLIVTSDRYAGSIQVRVEGAHSGLHALILPYGARMKEVLRQLNSNSMSQLHAIQLYRKSVAKRQREMLELSLRKLQELSLSATSATNEEASLRTQEANLISRLVQAVRDTVVKGQVVLSNNNLEEMLLEDGDIINIPERSSLVMVHGEVLMPNAVSWQKNMEIEDYIKKVGGFSQGLSKSRVIVIKQNGESLLANDIENIESGDEIMVLPKIETKNLELTKVISTIFYQVAVAAKVILNI